MFKVFIVIRKVPLLNENNKIGTRKIFFFILIRMEGK